MPEDWHSLMQGAFADDRQHHRSARGDCIDMEIGVSNQPDKTTFNDLEIGDAFVLMKTDAAPLTIYIKAGRTLQFDHNALVFTCEAHGEPTRVPLNATVHRAEYTKLVVKVL